jgi:hypothetical protein
MEIFKHEMDGHAGFLVKFLHRNEIPNIRSEIDALLGKLGEKPFGIPSIQWTSQGESSNALETIADESQRMFIETGSALVVKLEKKFIMPIARIAETIHQVGKCIGLSNAFLQLPTQEPFSRVITRFFSVDADDMLYLINYTFLHDCDSEAQRSELDIITNAL